MSNRHLKGVLHKIAWVNLSAGDVKIEEPPEEIYAKYLGGYGLGAYYLFRRQRAKVDPLGPENTRGLTTGPLTGTQAINGNRFTVVGKSPKTGGGVMPIAVERLGQHLNRVDLMRSSSRASPKNPSTQWSRMAK